MASRPRRSPGCTGPARISRYRRNLSGEVKARADGFRELYTWLEDRDVLIVKADRKEPLVVVRLSLAAALVST
jgi:hypothetical protein